MNKTIGIIVAVVVILGGAYLLMRAPGPTDTNVNGEPVNTEENGGAAAGAQGRVVFSVTDATADMSAISEINMKVSSVDVHSTGGAWTTVSTTPRTYSLLALNAENKSELLADVNAQVGTYDQVRLVVDSVAVKMKAGATKEAKLPSGELRINTKLVVKGDATSSVNFDFLADKSLHVTGSGEYIFAPVVKTESKSEASVTVDSRNEVSIEGGRTEDTNTVGMDIDGSVKLNFQINSKQKLSLGADGKIKLEGVLQ